MQKPELHECTWLDKSKYHYLSGSLPQLVLYSFASSTPNDSPDHPIPASWGTPKFQHPDQWVDLFHQTAGYACHHVFLHARFLEPGQRIKELMQRLSLDYYESCLSRYSDLKTVNAYEALLQKYGLTANLTYSHLAEGFYPIDGSCLGLVTEEKFPTNLQDMLESKEDSGWPGLAYYRFDLAILTENCD